MKIKRKIWNFLKDKLNYDEVMKIPRQPQFREETSIFKNTTTYQAENFAATICAFMAVYAGGYYIYY